MIRAVRPETTEEPELEAKIRSGIPDATWTRDELADRAVWENDRIGVGERCAPRYWYLGKILLVVQADVEPGGWRAWCAAHHIQRRRWQRGRHLALAFSSPDDVADLTVEAADALARKILGLPCRRSAADAKLRRWLTSTRKGVQKRLEEFASVTCVEGIQPQLAELIRDLRALDHACLALNRRASLSLRALRERAGVRAARSSKRTPHRLTGSQRRPRSVITKNGSSPTNRRTSPHQPEA